MNKIKRFVQDRRKLLLTIVGTLIVVFASLGLSFSFMTVLPTGENITDIGSTGNQTNTINFAPGAPLLLTPNEDNLNHNMGNVHTSTNPSVTLYAVNNSRNISAYYYVYLSITYNDYVYTTAEKTPELILTILDPSGTEITNLDGLTHVTVGSVSGFDVTTVTGFIPVQLNREISIASETSKTEEWTFRLTMVNLDSDQQLNARRTFEADVIMQNGPREEYNTSELILSHNGGAEYIESKGNPNYTKINGTYEQQLILPSSCTGTGCINKGDINLVDPGMYMLVDGYGANPTKSYYFRGMVDNNWVYFGGFYWRIIRINGDGSVRMIYSGISGPTEGMAYVKTGSDTVISGSNFQFNSTNNSSEHSGYMYELGVTSGNKESSVAKLNIETWFENNLLQHDEYLADAIYCNDRSTYTGTIGGTSHTGNGIGTEATWYYGAFRTTNNVPSLYCTNSEDAFTASTVSEHSNDSLDYPVGLITMDEALIAGMLSTKYDTSNYLYTGQNYWTMTPYLGSSSSQLYYISSNGNYGAAVANSSFGYRPVVSLKSNVLLTGTGKWNNPYIVTGLDV